MDKFAEIQRLKDFLERTETLCNFQVVNEQDNAYSHHDEPKMIANKKALTLTIPFPFQYHHTANKEVADRINTAIKGALATEIDKAKARIIELLK